MKKIIPLSLIAVASIYAAEVELGEIGVESTFITEVSKKAQTSADLANALTKEVPTIDMSRRSGIANDIFIRGQKRDNISIEVDGTKVCGACPNRMDPPVSHILASQIDTVDVIEGPYDVETFGVMSGGIKITTKKPKSGFSGEVTGGVGSWDYKKVGATVSGGNDRIRVLVSATKETSGQYEDGNGDDLSQQLAKNPNSGKFKYAYPYNDKEAYEKKSLMAKMYIDVTDDQELRLGYTMNRSDNVLYPNSKMDARYDDSNIYNSEYIIRNLSDAYKQVSLQYYFSDVVHPMDTHLREIGSLHYMTSKLKTTMQGLKLKNNFEFAKINALFGLDASRRYWDGTYYKDLYVVPTTAKTSSKSMDNAVTKNYAAFLKLDRAFGKLNLDFGMRYDSTSVDTDGINQQDNDYNGFNINIFASYNIDEENRVFFGVGQASRVPDARELYFLQNGKTPTGTPFIKVTGTDNLKDTTNRQVDLGYEYINDDFSFKIKTFYSSLTDFIYYNKNLRKNNFVNIDAYIYGGEISSEYFLTDSITLNSSASYKRGKKDKALLGQRDKDLADMAPLKANFGVSYEYMNDSTFSADIHMSDRWDTYDEDNGEQELAGWATIDLKVDHAINKSLNFTFGVNNLLDATYAQSNTYVDLILLSGGEDTMLINEPGRYFYTNLTYKF
jgi:iron complex outermembrane receptor protein